MVLAAYQINLTKIQSKPIVGPPLSVPLSRGLLGGRPRCAGASVGSYSPHLPGAPDPRRIRPRRQTIKTMNAIDTTIRPVIPTSGPPWRNEGVLLQHQVAGARPASRRGQTGNQPGHRVARLTPGPRRHYQRSPIPPGGGIRTVTNLTPAGRNYVTRSRAGTVAILASTWTPARKSSP